MIWVEVKNCQAKQPELYVTEHSLNCARCPCIVDLACIYCTYISPSTLAVGQWRQSIVDKLV